MAISRSSSSSVERKRWERQEGWLRGRGGRVCNGHVGGILSGGNGVEQLEKCSNSLAVQGMIPGPPGLGAIQGST
jgi:hypothetical protein